LLEAFAQFPALLIGGAALLGLVIGSFLNVVIHRLPLMMERDWQLEAAQLRNEPEPDLPAISLMKPASRCPHGQHRIRAWENVPLVSYAVLRGRCSACKAPISIRYPLIEAATAVLSGLIAWTFGPTLATAGALVLAYALIALAFIDADTQYLPDDITLPTLWVGLLLNLVGGFVSLPDAVIGATAGYLSLWIVDALFKFVTRRTVGMGNGDFKLLAALGAWLGWQMLPTIVLLSSVVGAVVGIAMIAFKGHDRENPIPFGPYIAGAGLLALFVGPQINAYYQSLM
jgi:leader peptidase (prepilin peptidase)/N-methyltransferase